MAKDRYRFYRAWQKFSSFMWSTIMRIVILAIILVVIYFALPWLQMLWHTISGAEFKNY